MRRVSILHKTRVQKPTIKENVDPEMSVEMDCEDGSQSQIISGTTADNARVTKKARASYKEYLYKFDSSSNNERETKN